jgi:hypothetical protein
MQCFNDLIRAYGMQGDAKRALQWHEKIEASLRRLPGISTYTAINYVHDLDEMSPQVANLLLDTACHRTLSRMRHTPKDGGGEEELILGKRLAVGAEPDNNNNLDDESASAAAILPPGIGVCNSAMWAFGRTGNIRMAAKLMDLMLRHWHRQPTMTTWNGFMLAYVRSGDHQNALNLWRYIVEHYQLSSTSNTDGNDNVRINQRTVSLVLQTCAELGEREAAKQLLAVAIKQRKSANTSDPDIFPAERPFDHLWRRTMIQHARRCQLVEEQFSDLQFPEFLKVSGCIAFEDLRRYHELMDNKELVARMEDIARDSTNLTPEQCHELFATIKLSS